MSADTPQQHKASSENAKQEPSAAKTIWVPVANETAHAAEHTDDARKLKSENEQLLSELQVLKQQMQVVQSREKGITKAYLGVCRDLDHALTSGKPNWRKAIVPLDQATVAGNANALSVSNPASTPNDPAVVASFNPIAGSNIFLEQSSAMEWTPATTDEAAGIASAAAARLEAARAKAASRTPSPRKAAVASQSPPAVREDEKRRDEGLAAVKEKIADLQGQHPGDAAKYLAALPASLKWRCFLGVSPAQRAAIMLEMSTDERKLALSMLRPGERTIAERFLGIKQSSETSSLASNTNGQGAVSPGGQSHASLYHSASFAAAAASIAAAPAPVGTAGGRQVLEAGQTSQPSSLLITGVASPQVQADFVRDSRQVFHSRGPGSGLLLEERLFSHTSPPALHTTKALPSLHSTNASMHAAVAQAMSSAVPRTSDAPDIYATNASVATVETVGTSLHNTQDGPQKQMLGSVQASKVQAALQQVGDLDALMGRLETSGTGVKEVHKVPAMSADVPSAPDEAVATDANLPAADAQAPADAAPVDPQHGAAPSTPPAEPVASGKTPDDADYFRGMDNDERLALSQSVSEMQRKVQETCESNPMARISFELDCQSNEASANAVVDKEDGNDEMKNAEKGKLSSKQKQALTSLPPKRPIPVPQFRGNGKEDGSHTSLSGWEHVLNTVSHKVQSARDMSPRSGFSSHKAQSVRGISPIGRAGSSSRHTNASTPSRHPAVTPRRASGEGSKRATDSPPPSFPPPTSPPVAATSAARRSASPTPQRMTVAEKSDRWQRYNSPPPARGLPKPPTSSGPGRRAQSREPSPRMFEEASTDTVFAQEVRTQSAPLFGSPSTHLDVAHRGSNDYAGNYHSSGSIAPLSAHSHAQAKDDFESQGQPASSAGSCVTGAAKSVGFVEEVVDQDNERKSLDETAARAVLSKIALENQALASQVSTVLLKGKAAGRAEDRKVQARPSRFARMLDVLGFKKLAQDPRRKPHTFPNRACNVPDITSNTPQHVDDALTPASLAVVLNQLQKLDAPLSNRAAECLGKSSLPFDAVPIKSIHRQSAANPRGAVWVDATWKGAHVARESVPTLNPRLIHAACSKMAENDKEVARRAFALLMAYLPEPMARDESPQRNSLGLTSGRSLWGSGAAVPTPAQHASSPFASPGIDISRPPGNDETLDPRQVQYLVDLLASVDPLLAHQAAGALAARGMLTQAAHEMLQRSASELSSVWNASPSMGNFSGGFVEGQSLAESSCPPFSTHVPDGGLQNRSAPPPIPLPPLPSKAPGTFPPHVPKLEIAMGASNLRVEQRDPKLDGDRETGGVLLESGTAKQILSILRNTENGLSAEIETALLSARSQSPHLVSDGEKLNTDDNSGSRARQRSTSNISNSLSPEEKAGVRAPASPSSLRGDYDIIWGVASQNLTEQGSDDDEKPRASPSGKTILPQKPSHSDKFHASPPPVASAPRLCVEAASSVGPIEAEAIECDTNGDSMPARAKEELPWTSWVRNKTRTASYKPASFLGSTSPPPTAPRTGQLSQESVVVSEDDMRKNREGIRKLLASPAGKAVYSRTSLSGKREPQNAAMSPHSGARHWGANFC